MKLSIDENNTRIGEVKMLLLTVRNTDMLGLTFSHVAKFVRNFMKEQAGETAIVDAFKAYHAAVLDGSFPALEHTFQIEL